MIKVGDKLYQVKYDWGKNRDGKYYVFEVTYIYGEHTLGGGRGLDCKGGPGVSALYIPESTYVKITDLRKNKLKRILK